jgi:carbamoyltransferase
MFGTALLGFKPNRHEGKLTGLAAHNQTNLKLRTLLLELREKTYKLNKSLSSGFIRWKNVYTDPKLIVDQTTLKHLQSDFLEFSREEIAYEIQYITENDIVNYLGEHLSDFGLPICVAGGLFANIKINKRLLDEGFPNIYIHPAMGDIGTAVGALSYVQAIEDQRQSLLNVCIGPSYTTTQIESTLKKYNLDFKFIRDVERLIAVELAKGNTIARMAGPLEYGPRALGNRSILSSAQNYSQIETLNHKLRRNDFMPFAPAILGEQFEDCVENSERVRVPSLWMTVACNATSTFMNYAPFLVHVDDTIRPQCVDKDIYPSFHTILEEYYQLTGIPCILNTSFNMHGEPIVCSPCDAISTFIKAKIDILVIDNFVVYRMCQA